MKPLPDELQFGPEMVLSVALEMEEKRRREGFKPDEVVDKDKDSDESDDDEDEDDQVLHSHSIDHIS